MPIISPGTGAGGSGEATEVTGPSGANLATEATADRQADAAEATENAVDELEADADATRVAAQSLDAKEPALEDSRKPVASRVSMGTTLTVLRGNATGSAAAFASQSFPRGFRIKNLSTSDSMYIAQSSGVTTANGWQIGPGESIPLELPNCNVIYHVTSGATVAWQVGGIS